MARIKDGNAYLFPDKSLKGTINLYNVYAPEFYLLSTYISDYGLDKRAGPKKKFSTAGVILHELLHLALFKNEELKIVKNDAGEVVDSYTYEPKVEDCTSKVFSNSMRFYDYQGNNEVKDKADDCNCENKEGKFRTSKNMVAFLNGPGNDHGDDNFSYADGLVKQFSIKSNALVYDSGYAEEMNNLINGVYWDGIDAAEQLFRASPVLVIPSGGLYGMENNSTFQYVLEEYVRMGGTLVVFAQQYGSHFDEVVPVPEGETLRSYGWREDQSCYNESSYYDSIHPAVTSWVAWGDLGTMQTDGYFDIYPSNSTVILNRTKNRKPLLLSYPVGEGTVILTSMFTDWGAAHSQSSITELRLVRDLVTFAQNPRKEIPTFDLSVNANPSVELVVNVENNTELTASKVKLTAYTPDRENVLHQSEHNVTLSPGLETNVDLSFGLPTLINTDYGICHVDYELYDAQGELIQMAAESDGGRFARIAKFLYARSFEWG